MTIISLLWHKKPRRKIVLRQSFKWESPSLKVSIQNTEFSLTLIENTQILQASKEDCMYLIDQPQFVKQLFSLTIEFTVPKSENLLVNHYIIDNGSELRTKLSSDTDWPSSIYSLRKNNKYECADIETVRGEPDSNSFHFRRNKFQKGMNLFLLQPAMG